MFTRYYKHIFGICLENKIDVACRSTITMSLYVDPLNIWLKFESECEFRLPFDEITGEEKNWVHSWNFEPKNKTVTIELNNVVKTYIGENYYARYKNATGGKFSIPIHAKGSKNSALISQLVRVDKFSTNSPWIFAIRLDLKEWKNPRLTHKIDGYNTQIEMITNCPELLDCILSYYQTLWDCLDSDFIRIKSTYFYFDGKRLNPNILFSEKFKAMDQESRDKLILSISNSK